VALDASDDKRLGKAFSQEQFGTAPLAVVDHHATNPGFGELNWIDPTAAATALLIIELADQMNTPISQEAATCLLTGIVTDTRGFRTSSVNRRVMASAERLMALGADLPGIAQRTLDHRPLGRIRLWGQALAVVQSRDGVIWTEITRSMRKATEADEGGEGELASFLLGEPNSYVSVVFSENADGGIDLGLRARPGHDVSEVAAALGGGGHPQASGCTVEGRLADVRERALALLFGSARAGAANDQSAEGRIAA
jgi:phosphoesterase RecJ-like protein